ncbi:hypothetical protein K4K49_000312 [Colletotrichum sp. SAR 10_70]|nr:hypothetical protein K4K50_002664 [Colletotrichum sp. SAR 10_71]KAI8185803.1 hypothetical protein K4K49_000312 [Colletotrichum sp. SAR 10_70]KAI8230149.1 hypothetical protein K4K54_000958 [Colletotrichum sp. SAR 10_86]
MHPDSDAIKDKHAGPGFMHDDDAELDDEFYMCLPTSIPGFNMQKKEWVRLDVEFIEDVQWNEEAFEYLVIDDNTKELVKAVAMVFSFYYTVVLLDEADVFLEERSLQNLERNALVSVFLRVLEYYDGK